MKNPLSSLPMTHPAVPEGTFRRGFIKGAGSGALMMSIFSGVLFVGSLLPIPGNPLHFAPLMALGTTLVGTLTTGLFSGITASQRAVESVNIASSASHPASRAPITRAPEHSVAPHIEQAAHNSKAWTERVASSRASTPSKVDQILADRSLNDGDRAAAILREREQSNTLNASR